MDLLDGVNCYCGLVSAARDRITEGEDRSDAVLLTHTHGIQRARVPCEVTKLLCAVSGPGSWLEHLKFKFLGDKAMSTFRFDKSNQADWPLACDFEGTGTGKGSMI